MDADSGSDYGGFDEKPKPKQPEIPKSQLQRAKNDVSKGIANLKVKNKTKTAEDDMWGDLGGGESKTSNNWDDDWSAPAKTTATKTASKPKLSPASRRKQLEEKKKQRLAEREAKKQQTKVVKKKEDSWGDDDW